MKGKTILIVHGEKKLTDLLANMLHEEGLRALRAGDLSEAESTIRYFEPDLILVDLQPLRRASPDARAMLSGSESGGRIPVLALAPPGDSGAPLDGLEVAGSIQMPFKPDELMAQIGRQLGTEAAGTSGQDASAGGREQELSGDLKQIGVTELLTMFDMGRRGGRVNLDDGTRTAWLILEDGDVTGGGIDGEARGADVINELIDWESGRFEVVFGDAEGFDSAAEPPEAEDDAAAQQERSTLEFSLPSNDRSYLKKLVEEPTTAFQSSAPPREEGPAPEPISIRSSTGGSEQGAHAALTLLNTVSSYAGGFMEKKLLQRKLEGVRQRLVKTQSGLSVFEVFPDATIGLRPGESENYDDRSIVDGTASWLTALALDVDRTFPGSFPRTTLLVLVESADDGDDRFGFLEALGFSGAGP